MTFDGKIAGAVEIARNITDVQKLSHTIMNFQQEITEPEDIREKRIKAYSFDMIIGKNKRFADVVERAKKASQSDASVLGETEPAKNFLLRVSIIAATEKASRSGAKLRRPA